MALLSTRGCPPCTPAIGKGHGMQHPRGGFGRVSTFLGSGGAAWMGNPKGEVWDTLLGKIMAWRSGTAA